MTVRIPERLEDFRAGVVVIVAEFAPGEHCESVLWNTGGWSSHLSADRARILAAALVHWAEVAG